MQLKAADDKQPDLDALEALVARPDVDRRVRRQIENEVWNIRTGQKTENGRPLRDRVSTSLRTATT